MLLKGNELIPFIKSQDAQNHTVQSGGSRILAKNRQQPPAFTLWPLTDPGPIICQGAIHGEHEKLKTVSVNTLLTCDDVIDQPGYRNPKAQAAWLWVRVPRTFPQKPVLKDYQEETYCGIFPGGGMWR